MKVVTTKRTKEKQQHYKSEEWDYNTHQLIPAHYEMNRVGYLKKELHTCILLHLYSFSAYPQP